MFVDFFQKLRHLLIFLSDYVVSFIRSCEVCVRSVCIICWMFLLITTVKTQHKILVNLSYNKIFLIFCSVSHFLLTISYKIQPIAIYLLSLFLYVDKWKLLLNSFCMQRFNSLTTRYVTTQVVPTLIYRPTCFSVKIYLNPD